MMREQWPVVIICAYFLLFVGAVVGLGKWKVKRRRDRPPVEFKFLRGPGETLRRRIAKFDEDFYSGWCGCACPAIRDPSGSFCRGEISTPDLGSILDSVRLILIAFVAALIWRFAGRCGDLCDIATTTWVIWRTVVGDCLER